MAVSQKKLSRKARSKAKSIPLRTCLGCGKKAAKEALVRFVLLDDKMVADPTGKFDGRGGYCCNSERCFRQMLKNTKRLARAFRREAAAAISMEPKSVTLKDCLKKEPNCN